MRHRHCDITNWLLNYLMRRLYVLLLAVMGSMALNAQRVVTPFNEGWKFLLGDDSAAREARYDAGKWRTLNVPHDWSIEGSFSDKHPATNQGGALPTGIGWYRKTFTIPASAKDKLVYINFDGVHCNSEVWINGHYLGKRPNGYISFRYELTDHLLYGKENVIAVKVDNSAQPASRWYTGSGIYRKVWLLTTDKMAFNQWGVFVSTPEVSRQSATVSIATSILHKGNASGIIGINHAIYNAKGVLVSRKEFTQIKPFPADTTVNMELDSPFFWSPDSPYLYKLVSQLYDTIGNLDAVETFFGVRYFDFDAAKGFSLNGKPLKILGVCQHHDLGALGAAVNERAIERQLEILKAMGCNAIRTAHNPPATELLELCDRMGFLVMDETFDMWRKRKNRQDYHQYFTEWSRRDIQDHVKRDRNHASVFMWSIGNEIREQFDSTGLVITRQLADAVKEIDPTRPVTCALTENFPEKNFIYRSGALDVLGFNYKLDAYAQLPARFPGQKFLATETSSALATRGHYDMPSDSVRLWPPDSKSPFTKGNPDLTVSAYDHVYAYWGSTHEAGWNAVKKHDFIGGIFVWSGFDFLGEPVPYPWPARSSYYGIIDLAGFPKDSYYMYQSEWTLKPILHLFPHWNWPQGKVVDVWAYYNNADEVELFLNGQSLGTRKKQGDTLHVSWRVPFTPGTLKAVSRKGGAVVLEKTITTAGKPAKIRLEPDRKAITTGNDLSFITVKITDAAGNVVPDAANLVRFRLKGNGYIAGVDNGQQTSMEPFKGDHRKAFNGKCLVIVGANGRGGKIEIEAISDGLSPASVTITAGNRQ